MLIIPSGRKSRASACPRTRKAARYCGMVTSVRSLPDVKRAALRGATPSRIIFSKASAPGRCALHTRDDLVQPLVATVPSSAAPGR